jgi:diguanylate cyclase (GGDEF)-like protein
LLHCPRGRFLDDDRPDSETERSPDWLEAFDAMLGGLSARRPLADIFDDVVRHAAGLSGAAHAFVGVASREAPDGWIRAGVGLWASVAPEAVDAAVRRRNGAVRTWPEDPAGTPTPGGPLLAVPVRMSRQPVGVLAIAGDAPAKDWGGPEERLLAGFAQLAAIAHENDRLFGTERAAREQAQALHAATQALSATLSLRDVLAAILSELQNVVPYDTASVQQLQGERMVIIGGRGIDLAEFLGVGFEAVRGSVPNRDVLRHRAPVIVGDILGAHGYADFPHPAHAMSGVRSWLGVPLLFGSRCTGMLTLDKCQPHFYTGHHAQAALAFAAQAAIAIENASLFERSQRELLDRRRAEDELRGANARLSGQLAEIEALQARLREQAVRDALTGLFNRRYLTETLQRELARCAREARPLSVVMLDVDHFKALNDASGHEAGDRVLQALSGLLAEQVRQEDVACRFGGEEFVIVLPGASAADAAARAEAWREAVLRLQVPHQDATLSVTVSMGVAERGAGAHADDLLRRADQALYEAKRGGRNRVVAAG